MPKALFLDRDGVINKEINYLYRQDDFIFLDGIFDVCRHFQRHGFHLIVVTNQAGIARGLYTEHDFHTLTEWMLAEFRAQNVDIEKVYFCPYHAEAGIGRYRRESSDRKPNPGMLLKARDEFDLSLPDSYLVGDKESDIEAGINAGVGTNILLATAAGSPPNTRANLTIHQLKDLPDLIDLK